MKQEILRIYSEVAQKEMEQSKAENEQAEDRAVFSVFGSAPVCEVSDGQKTASFSHGTWCILSR